MPRSLWLADVLADAYRGVHGVRFEVYPGWKTRGHEGAQHRGIVNHHTGRGGYDPLLQYMATGSSIAPLCNVASSHDGSRVTLVAAGKANHAGRGHLSWTGTDRGNWYSVGWEAQNDGGQSWPTRHLESIAIGNAAILRHLKLDSSRLAEHKTYAPRRKVDRHSIILDEWQRRVQRMLNNYGRRYKMLVFVPGTPDADQIGWCERHLRPVPGVVTRMKEEAEAAVARGETVVAVGASLSGARTIRGANRQETAKLLIDWATRGWQ